MIEREFLEKFAAQFDETDASQINMDSNFRDIQEWSSMYALSVIAMIDDEFSVKITGDDIRKSHTVKDIFNLVRNRLS